MPSKKSLIYFMDQSGFAREPRAVVQIVQVIELNHATVRDAIF
jgi:hypothetical protein